MESNKSVGRDNYNFVQINREYLRNMRELTAKSPLAMTILFYLTEHMGRTTNAVVCSYRTLGEVTGLSRTSVAKAIKILKQDNWIDAIKIGNATAYCINERVAWQAGRNERQYAKFSATVIASAEEQEVGFLEKAKHKLTYVPVIEDGDRPIVGNEKLPPPDQQDLDL
jgi:hypothetical protein